MTRSGYWQKTQLWSSSVPQLLCADPKETSPRIFHLNNASLFLITTNFSAPAEQHQLSQESKGFVSMVLTLVNHGWFFFSPDDWKDRFLIQNNSNKNFKGLSDFQKLCKPGLQRQHSSQHPHLPRSPLSTKWLSQPKASVQVASAPRHVVRSVTAAPTMRFRFLY